MAIKDQVREPGIPPEHAATAWYKLTAERSQPS